MKRTKKLLAGLIAVLMVLAIVPLASLAQTVNAASSEARKLAKLDDAWKSIEAVEKEAMERKAEPSEVTKAAYTAALNDPLVDEGSLVWESAIQFAFTVDGMHCLYYYTARNAQKGDAGEVDVVSFGTKTNGAEAIDVLLVGPYYGQDSSFTDQYKEEATSLAETMGGTRTMLSGTSATGPAIVQNYLNKGVVIYDSHGTQSGISSYLCLTTNSGITTEDYDNGWAVSSGSAAYIDGRYIQNHVSGQLSNCLVWMAICEGMKKSGNGTTGTALLDAGAGAVYGYSQSVTFAGDYEYEETFWNEMKDGATMADALVVMKNTHGVPDPYGDAYPIVMSPVDPFPSNPDAAQSVNCDWVLFGDSEPVALESFVLTDANGDTLTSLALPMCKTKVAKVSATPYNANNYTVAWSSSNTNIATVNPATNGKSATIVAKNVGSATITATVTTESKAVMTKTINLTVTEPAQWVPVDTITPGEPYLIGFVANGTTYLAVNNNNGSYYNNVSSNYYGYTAPAVFNGQNVIGVNGVVDDLEYCTWIFSSANGGTIQSGYESGMYLVTWTYTNWADCYVDDSAQTWTYSNHQLYRTIDSTNRYAQYVSVNGGNYMCVGNSVPSGYSVQLYSMAEPDPTAPVYTVTFKDWDGTTLKTEEVLEGAAATAPADPTRVGYTFTGWDVDFSNVMSDLVVTAQYQINTYTVTFKDWDGTVLKTQTVNYGGAATAPADPQREGYTFTGWDVDFSNVTSDLIVTAQYVENGPTVTLLGDVDCDGTVTAADALLAMRHAMAITIVSGQGFVNGDMDGDGQLTSSDAILIMRAVMGL